MKKYNMLVSAAVLFGSMASSFAAPVEYAGAELKKNFKISMAADQKTADTLTVKTIANNKSAIYQQNLVWQTGEIKQIIVTAKVDKPGTLRFASNTFVDGKKFAVNVYVPAIADGEFHDYIFDVAGHKNWQGIMKNYELRWFGPADTLLEVKKFTAASNAIIKYIGNGLKGKVSLFNAKELKGSNELVIQTTKAFGGFHQQKLAWKADEINTVSFMLKSDKPGTLRYACSLKKGDNKALAGISLPVQNIPGDNQYHLYTFDLTVNPQFAGIQTNYELRFIGPQGATLALKEVTAGKKAAAEKKTEKSVKKAPVAVPAPAAKGRFTKSELSGAGLIQYVHPFRAEPVADKNAVRAQLKQGIVGGFYQDNVSYDTNVYKQVEITLACNIPGYWNFAAGCVKDGQRAVAGIPPVAAVPDGKYHTYVFNISDSHNWRGNVTNWEVRYLGYDPAEISIKAIKFLKKPNLIPDASNLPVNKEVITGKLMPRAKCVLNWPQRSP